MFVQALEDTIKSLAPVDSPFFLIGSRSVVHHSCKHRAEGARIFQQCRIDEGMNRTSILNPDTKHFERLVVEQPFVALQAKLVSVFHAASRWRTVRNSIFFS